MATQERIDFIRDRLPSNKALVISNPHAGGRRRNNHIYTPELRKVCDMLSDPRGLKLDVGFVETTDVVHAERVIWEATQNGVGLIASKGGDKTAASNAYSLRQTEHNTQLLLLGGGRQNILQNELVTTLHPVKALTESLFKGHPEKVDIGIFKTSNIQSPFLTNMGIGLDGEVLRAWNADNRRYRITMWPYFREGRKRFGNYDFALTQEDGKTQEYKNKATVAIINGGDYGGHLSVSDSYLNDGTLEAVFVDLEVLSNRGVVDLFVKTYQGKKREKGLTHVSFKRATIKVTNTERIVYQTDGDDGLAGNTAELYTLPKAFTLWVPDRSTDKLFLPS